MANQVASALASGDISSLPFNVPTDQAVKEYGIVMAGLDGATPQVQVTDITYQQDTQQAIVRLNQTYDLGQPWQFPSLVTLDYAGSAGWQVDWTPTIIQPALDGYTRLSSSRQLATRGEILADDQSPIVYNRPVERVGIDKSQVSADQALDSARALAKLLGINADNYVTKVKNGGPKQFVIAITLRQGMVPAGTDKIPGTLLQAATMSLGPSTTFAIGLLGTAGDATAEDIQNSGGKFHEGDTVGHSGLQASQDTALRGTDGVTVYLTPRADADVMVPTTPLPSDSPQPTPSTERQVLFKADPVDGASVQTTLNVDAQMKAEKALAHQSGVAALVVLDVHTGAILAAANSPDSGQNSYATTGRYAPGSTFKVSTALAMLRAGSTPDSHIDCPTSVTVDGMKFTNYSDYGSSHYGNITLRQAVAYSCNTAMINGAMSVGDDALANAAASLGIGVDHDLGFPAFLGSVPSPITGTDKAAAGIGQGAVLASPLSMAAEAASVASGHTVVPYLLVDPDTGQPIDTSTSATPPDPLTSQEASQLRDIMGAVVQYGTGTGLQGLAQGAKTGSAEFMDNGTMKTHAWMIAYTSKYAIAAYVHIGSSGAGTAGPLIKSFLS